jgi:hypothetical protein
LRPLRCLAALLVLALLPSLFAGCGPRTKSPGQIVIITGGLASMPEEYAKALALESAFDKGTVIVRRVDDADLQSYTKMRTLAEQLLVSYPNLYGIVYARGTAGILGAAEYLHTTRPETHQVVCVPETSETLWKIPAELILDYDRTAMAEAAVEAAKTLGAGALLYFHSERQQAESGQQALQTAIQTQCKDQGLDYDYNLCPDTRETSAEDLQTYYHSIVAAHAQKNAGQTIAYFAADPQAQRWLVDAALQQKGVVPGMSYGALSLGFPAAFSVDLKDHYGDAAYLLERVSAAAKEQEVAGQIALWQLSLPAAMVGTAVEYLARGYEKAPTDSHVRAAAKAAAGRQLKVRALSDTLPSYGFICPLKPVK